MPISLSTQVKKLHSNGWSTRAISLKLLTKKSTILRYINKDKFPNKSLGYIKSCERKRRYLANLDKVNNDRLSKKRAKVYAALLYWCEGSKYPASTTLNFTSSDAKMQRLFISLLRKGFNPIESKFRVWLQFHTGQDKIKIFRYWSSILKVPTTQFIKPRITNKNGGRYRRVYYGTCSLRYADYTLTLRLMGIYQRFYKQALIKLV